MIYFNNIAKRHLDDHTSAQKKLKSNYNNKEFLKRIKTQERELVNQTTILQGTKSFEKLGDQVKAILYSKENDKSANKSKTQQNNKKLSAEGINMFYYDFDGWIYLYI